MVENGRNMLDVLKFIKPKKRGASDKFSWNLYRYVKEKGMAFRVYYYRDNENDLPDMADYWRSGKLYLLTHPGGSGNRISQIMAKGQRDNMTTFAFCAWKAENFIDVTDDFIEQYLRDGRCCMDREHHAWWSGAEERLTIINANSMRCNWCGKYLRRKIVTHKRITRSASWEVEGK